MDVIWEESDFVSFQPAYLKNKQKPQRPETSATILELHLALMNEMTTELRTVASRLAWIAPSTFTRSACKASMAPQGKSKRVTILNSCDEAYLNASKEKLISLLFVPLEFFSIQAQIVSNLLFQNLPEKHLQIEFTLLHSDGHDQCNLFQRHSSRATRWPASTDEAELLALDIYLLRLCNCRRNMFQLL